MNIEKMIYIIRGQKVMLDSDLAELYGVETKQLTRQVRRNFSRFPDDFLILPNVNELEDLRSQIGAAIASTHWNHMRRTPPMLFTENGVAMLSSVLNSEQAIQVNITIIRTFTKLRSYPIIEDSIESRVSKLEEGTNKLFKIVFERMDNYEELLPPKLSPNRKKIGIKKGP